MTSMKAHARFLREDAIGTRPMGHIRRVALSAGLQFGGKEVSGVAGNASCAHALKAGDTRFRAPSIQ